MLYLRTLGSVYIADESGLPITGTASQRRLLALLSILAASGDGGASRDRLISLLWPEADTERGRNSLTQAVYQLRRALDIEDLFLAGASLRLNAERITSDIRELEQAVAARDFVQAAATYRGGFLDDFHLPGNGEFDRWAESQRSRVSALMQRAYDRLACESAGAGRLPEAVEWRRHELALDPLSSPAARRLILAIRDAGDPAGALRQLLLHEGLVRSELEADLDPELKALKESLRTTRSVQESTLYPEPLSGPPMESSSAAPPPLPSGGVHQLRRRGGLALLATAAALAWALTALKGRATGSPAQTLPRFDQQVVVAPFRVTGADPSLAFLREGLVELIAVQLEDDQTGRAVDPGAVLRAWRQSHVMDSTDMQLSDVMRIVDRFGARGVVTGAVVGDARHLVISAALTDVGDTATIYSATAQGPLDSLATLVDQIARTLLITSAGESDRLVGRAQLSLPALRAYLSGVSAYRDRRYPSASRELEKAIRLDSTFALAAMYLAFATDRINAGEQHDRALAMAWEHRAELGERDRLQLVAFAGPRYPEPSSEAEQLAAWEAAVARSPDRAEVLLELAERFVRSGRLLGVHTPDRRAERLLERVLELDPHEPSANGLSILLRARDGARESRQAGGRRWVAADSVPVFVRWRVALANGDSAGLAGIQARFPTLGDQSLATIGRLSMFDAIGVGDGERALHIKRLRARTAGEQLDAILAQHSLAVNQGRQILALDLTEQLEESQPGSRAHLRLRILDALYGGGDSAAAVRAAGLLGPIVDAPPVTSSAGRAIQLADACVLAQWRLDRGELAGINRLITELKSAGVPRNAVPIGANPHTCAALLDASLAVSSKARDAAGRVKRLDALMLGGPAASDATAYAHIVVARLYERLGKPEKALAAIRRRAYMDGWPRYLATARREEGRLALGVGDRPGGLAAYRAYLAVRTAAEGSAAVEAAEVRAVTEAGERQ